MCWEDIKIARATRAIRYNLTIPAASTVLKMLDYNRKRYSLLIGGSIDGAVRYSFGEPTDVTTSMVLLAVQANPILINLHDHGDLVRLPLFAFTLAAGARVQLVETVLEMEGP